jgi:uridine kinase
LVTDGTPASEQRLQDIAALASSQLLSAVPLEDIGFLLGKLTLVTLPRGKTLRLDASDEPALHFLLDGQVELEDGRGERRLLATGEAFGVTALIGRPSSETAMPRSEVRLARLTLAAYAALAETHPRAALHLAEGALRGAMARLGEDELPAGARAARLVAEGTVTSGSPVRGGDRAPTVRVGQRLPRTVDGALVVAGRLGERLLSLHTLIDEAAVITPMTTLDWEGRDIYRRSAGLVLLEVARQLGVQLQLGPSITSGRLVFTTTAGDRSSLAQALDERLTELCRASIGIREELWSVQDAIRLFHQQDDPNACLLLDDELEPVVTLLRCGDTWASVPQPLLPDAGMLVGVRVLEHPQGFLLDFGPHIRRTLPVRQSSTVALELRSPRYGAPMTRSQAEWLKALGVESVGTYNRLCVRGKVAELIRVCEGFHEKRIANIADLIQQRGSVRVVAVAGPSSSGKTTFIKRLLVQLRVNGFEPLELSLDDYYMDRESQVPDANGELDFEKLEALDLSSLHRDLDALLSGETVRPPRYDFQRGVSQPRAGTELRLGERSVLLLEGIHALNPGLYQTTTRAKAFSIFIHPATSLAFDRLSSLEPADVRLLRRVVRDRHQRGFATEDTLSRWPGVRRAERLHISPFQAEADAVFDSSLVYEVSVLRVYAERYLLEVPRHSPMAPSARRMRQLLQQFVPIHPDHVPPTSLLREFIGGSGFSY